MIKVFSLLRRRKDWTREEFHKWWIEGHVPYAVKLPDLRKYKVSLTKGPTAHEGQEPFERVVRTLRSRNTPMATPMASVTPPMPWLGAGH